MSEQTVRHPENPHRKIILMPAFLSFPVNAALAAAILAVLWVVDAEYGHRYVVKDKDQNNGRQKHQKQSTSVAKLHCSMLVAWHYSSVVHHWRARPPTVGYRRQRMAGTGFWGIPFFVGLPPARLCFAFTSCPCHHPPSPPTAMATQRSVPYASRRAVVCSRSRKYRCR